MLYPLRFAPNFKPYLWGGRRLAEWLPTAPADGPVAEAWLVSDEPATPSRVADGPLRGRTLAELLAEFGPRLLGRPVPANGRFPLLLKFLDAAQALSVQVHPNDEQAARIAPGGLGKTEAWVVLRAEPGSRIYAGLKPGVTEADLRRAMAEKRVADCLHSFTPRVGDCVFLRAGTVHALGAGLLIFEVQQTSDITYRLYDWDRVDATTGRPRALHVEEGLACTDFSAGPCGPVTPTSGAGGCEQLVDCDYFRLRRITTNCPANVGAIDECRLVAAVDGEGVLTHAEQSFRLTAGDALLLPAEVGECCCDPRGYITLLECGLPTG